MKHLALAVPLLAVVGLAACGDEQPTPPAIKPVPSSAPPVVKISYVDGIRGTPGIPAWAKVAPEQIAEAMKHGVSVAFENELGMRFVLIPSGTFLMGSPEDEAGRSDEPFVELQHPVTLARPYYMQVTEVTNEQYNSIVPEHDSGEWDGVSLRDPRCPATQITWFAATAFAAALSGRDGSRTYGLPTEAQWEHACRAGTRMRWWWEGDESVAIRYANVADTSLTRRWGHDEVFPGDDGFLGPAPVGSFPPNPWGLHDMLGNVWEWCHDWFGPYSWVRAIDPAGPTTESRRGRVERGGSWYAEPASLRCAARCAQPPESRGGLRTGFRLVSPLPEPQGGK